MLAPTIALFLRTSEAHAYILAGLDAAWSIRVCQTLSELIEVVVARRASLVVTDASDEHGRSNAAVIAAIHARDERLPIVVVCAIGVGQAQLVLDIARAGATGLLLRGVDDSRHAIRTALQQASRHTAAQRVYDEVVPLLPTAAVPFLRYAISRASDEPSVTQAAREVGVDRKTLLNWLRHTRVSPSEFLNWIRLALAIGALEGTTRSAERVALDLGFASGTAFRNMLQRYAGRTTGEMRSPGSFDEMLIMFKARLMPALEHAVPVLTPPLPHVVRRRA